jgi:hypothetical protein
MASTVVAALLGLRMADISKLITPDWPACMAVLWEPSAARSRAATGGYFRGAHRLDSGPLVGEPHGCGFSPSGRHFVLAASDAVLVTSRP